MKYKYLILMLVIISFSFLLGCGHQQILVDGYPRHFDIITNDGEDLEVKIDEIIPGDTEYYYQILLGRDDELLIEQKVSPLKKVSTLEKSSNPDPGVIRAKITKTGRYKFRIYLDDEEHRVGASWRIISNAIKKRINEGYKNPVWEQDVFVVRPDPEGLSTPKIDELATKHAPFLLLHADEHYFPASINFLLNKENTDEKLNDLKLSIKFNKIDLNSKKKITRRTRFTGVAMKDIKRIAYKDLDKVLPYNGDNISELNTIGLNIFRLFGKDTLRDALEVRTDNINNVTVYYSYFPNPNQEKKEVIINYHFLYIYDSKKEAKGDMKKASHIFDRESISIVFRWDKSNPDVNPDPKYMIFGAHLPEQLITLKREDKGEEQYWRTRRVKVKWKDVKKIKIGGNKEFHPIVAIARGSHATYPVPGDYAVKPIDIIKTIEPARINKLLLPSRFSYDSKRGKIFSSNNVLSYKLKDLKLGSITSSSPNSILAFSGYIVDIIGLTDAKFPPFTERETEIENWVNGTDDDPVHIWDPDKVDQKTKEELGDLVTDIEDNLTKKVISDKANVDIGGGNT
jgi:hypothetical protein